MGFKKMFREMQEMIDTFKETQRKLKRHVEIIKSTRENEPKTSQNEPKTSQHALFTLPI